jgi:hypothetical protein
MLKHMSAFVQRHSRSPSAHSEGILTLADRHFYEGLVLLADSVRQCCNMPLICYDGGLTAMQRHAVSNRLSNVELRPIPRTPEIALVRDALSRGGGRDRDEWLMWICPLLITTSPFRRTFWIDCDVVVLRDLSRLFRMLDTGPVFTPSDNKFGLTPNASCLYELLPLSETGGTSGEPLINAGVIGFDLQRDSSVLRSYIYPVLRAARDDRIRGSISWHDQGALIWAVRNHGLQDRVVDASWNTAVRSLPFRQSDKVFSTYKWDSTLFSAIRNDFPNVRILHWNGLAQKLWHDLER